MEQEHRYEKIKGWIEDTDDGFLATCKCGWTSKSQESKEAAVIDLENHIESTSRHISGEREEKSDINLFSLFLAFAGILFAIFFDPIPGGLGGVGWI